MKLGFSPLAQDDLFHIGLHIAADNPTRAISFVDELEAKCLTLCRTPGLGSLRPELGEGLSMLPHGRYLIFYRQAQGAIRIERIMHSARDIGSEDLGGAG